MFVDQSGGEQRLKILFTHKFSNLSETLGDRISKTPSTGAVPVTDSFMNCEHNIQ